MKGTKFNKETDLNKYSRIILYFSTSVEEKGACTNIYINRRFRIMFVTQTKRIKEK